MRILLLSDIHGNFPALQAIEQHFHGTAFDYITNCGDTLVYGPFPNETLDWLREHQVVSILGNTDRTVKDILEGRPFTKPRKDEKRIMYTVTVDQLRPENAAYLCSLKKSAFVSLSKEQSEQSAGIHLFHGSPADPDEFLFPDTPDKRFKEFVKHLEGLYTVTGHTHMPYIKQVKKKTFINPGSVGRMFDGNPQASCAVLEIENSKHRIRHYRIDYDIQAVVREIQALNLPEIYATMFTVGRKLN